jgi:hypothetical protein
MIPYSSMAGYDPQQTAAVLASSHGPDLQSLRIGDPIHISYDTPDELIERWTYYCAPVLQADGSELCYLRYGDKEHQCKADQEAEVVREKAHMDRLIAKTNADLLSKLFAKSSAPTKITAKRITNRHYGVNIGDWQLELVMDRSLNKKQEKKARYRSFYLLPHSGLGRCFPECMHLQYAAWVVIRWIPDMVDHHPSLRDLDMEFSLTPEFNFEDLWEVVSQYQNSEYSARSNNCQVFMDDLIDRFAVMDDDQRQVYEEHFPVARGIFSAFKMEIQQMLQDDDEDGEATDVSQG